MMTQLYEDLIIFKNRLSQTNLQFNAIASVEAIAKFEKDNQVVLPADYKFFIQHIGNGGDGPPEYGIMPLGTNESWWFEIQRNAWLNFQSIRQPFPFSEQWIWEGDELENVELQNKIFDGNIYLGTDGCGMDWTLVITGEEHGFVWQITEVGITPCKPRMTFLQWFNKWLEHDKSSPVPFWWAD